MTMIVFQKMTCIFSPKTAHNQETTSINPQTMKSLYLTTILILSILFPFAAASAGGTAPQPGQAAGTDSLEVSLLTCYPGTEIYELYGHSAIRIRNAEFDSVWNYGVFDFNAPNFAWRFAMGKPEYCLAATTTGNFLYPYRNAGRRVDESRLQLSQAEASRLLQALRTNALPQNAAYTYNYLFDNCSTRILDRIENAAGDSLIIATAPKYRSFRHAMKHYHRNSKWYELGIDVALGSDIDKPLTARQQVFIPLELMRVLDESKFADGRKVVLDRTVLIDNPAESKATSTPAYLSPLAVNTLLAVIFLIICIYFLYTKRICKTIYAVFYALIGIGGLLLAFLVFVSDNAATDTNYLLMWLNPLAILVPVFIWFKKLSTRWIVYAYLAGNALNIILFFIIFPIFNRSINYSTIPISFIDLMLSLTYVVVLFRNIVSGNKPDENNMLKNNAKK